MPRKKKQVSKRKMTTVEAGRIGGKKRARRLSKARRSEIARAAANARWYGGHDIGAI